MPSFKAHAAIGAGVGFAAYCAVNRLRKVADSDIRFELDKAVIWAGVGAFAASIPDILEPAVSPNHRGFFHSFFVLLAIVWFIVLACGGTISTAALLVVAAAGYASHLIVDSFTRRCLPWI
jgi:membrane-bound metal-dependent hydrolase YbcI (DUF457 family)